MMEFFMGISLFGFFLGMCIFASRNHVERELAKYWQETEEYPLSDLRL